VNRVFSIVVLEYSLNITGVLVSIFSSAGVLVCCFSWWQSVFQLGEELSASGGE